MRSRLVSSLLRRKRKTSIAQEIGPKNLRYGEDHPAVRYRLGQLRCEPSRPLFRHSRLAAWAEPVCLAAEMKQSFRATARAPDAGEAVRGVPAVREPIHYTLHRAAQRTAGVLESILIGADEVLPVVTQDLAERIISKDAGAVSHGVFPAGVKQALQAAVGQGRCRVIGKGRLLLMSGSRRAAYGTETRTGHMAKRGRDCNHGCRPRTQGADVSEPENKG